MYLVCRRSWRFHSVYGVMRERNIFFFLLLSYLIGCSTRQHLWTRQASCVLLSPGSTHCVCCRGAFFFFLFDSLGAQRWRVLVGGLFVFSSFLFQYFSAPFIDIFCFNVMYRFRWSPSFTPFTTVVRRRQCFSFSHIPHYRVEVELVVGTTPFVAKDVLVVWSCGIIVWYDTQIYFEVRSIMYLYVWYVWYMHNTKYMYEYLVFIWNMAYAWRFLSRVWSR